MLRRTNFWRDRYSGLRTYHNTFLIQFQVLEKLTHRQGTGPAASGRCGRDRREGIEGRSYPDAPSHRPGREDFERRRWESNPLEPGCSRSPGRLAPASSVDRGSNSPGDRCPRQELNLVSDLRRVVCESVTLRGRDSEFLDNPPPGNRTRPCGFEDRRAPDTLAGRFDARPAASRRPVRCPRQESNLVCDLRRVACDSVTPQGPESSHHQQGRKDSNPVREFWRLAALPGAHPYRSSRVFGGS
jgi:hypothetical protein